MGNSNSNVDMNNQINPSTKKRLTLEELNFHQLKHHQNQHNLINNHNSGGQMLISPPSTSLLKSEQQQQQQQRYHLHRNYQQQQQPPHDTIALKIQDAFLHETGMTETHLKNLNNNNLILNGIDDMNLDKEIKLHQIQNSNILPSLTPIIQQQQQKSNQQYQNDNLINSLPLQSSQQQSIHQIKVLPDFNPNGAKLRCTANGSILNSGGTISGRKIESLLGTSSLPLSSKLPYSSSTQNLLIKKQQKQQQQKNFSSTIITNQQKLRQKSNSSLSDNHFPYDHDDDSSSDIANRNINKRNHKYNNNSNNNNNNINSNDNNNKKMKNNNNKSYPKSDDILNNYNIITSDSLDKDILQVSEKKNYKSFNNNNNKSMSNTKIENDSLKNTKDDIINNNNINNNNISSNKNDNINNNDNYNKNNIAIEKPIEVQKRLRLFKTNAETKKKSNFNINSNITPVTRNSDEIQKSIMPFKLSTKTNKKTSQSIYPINSSLPSNVILQQQQQQQNKLLRNSLSDKFDFKQKYQNITETNNNNKIKNHNNNNNKTSLLHPHNFFRREKSFDASLLANYRQSSSALSISAIDQNKPNIKNFNKKLSISKEMLNKNEQIHSFNNQSLSSLTISSSSIESIGDDNHQKNLIINKQYSKKYNKFNNSNNNIDNLKQNELFDININDVIMTNDQEQQKQNQQRITKNLKKELEQVTQKLKNSNKFYFGMHNNNNNNNNNTNNDQDKDNNDNSNNNNKSKIYNINNKDFSDSETHIKKTEYYKRNSKKNTNIDDNINDNNKNVIGLCLSQSSEEKQSTPETSLISLPVYKIDTFNLLTTQTATGTTNSYDNDTNGIQLNVRPILPRRQLEVPRFSPVTAWRMLSDVQRLFLLNAASSSSSSSMKYNNHPFLNNDSDSNIFYNHNDNNNDMNYFSTCSNDYLNNNNNNNIKNNNSNKLSEVVEEKIQRIFYSPQPMFSDNKSGDSGISAGDINIIPIQENNNNNNNKSNNDLVNDEIIFIENDNNDECESIKEKYCNDNNHLIYKYQNKKYKNFNNDIRNSNNEDNNNNNDGFCNINDDKYDDFDKNEMRTFADKTIDEPLVNLSLPCHNPLIPSSSLMEKCLEIDEKEIKNYNNNHRFKYQSRARQMERNRLAEYLSREAEEREALRKIESEVINRVEKEFQKKRVIEKMDACQRLRLLSSYEDSHQCSSLPVDLPRI